MNRFIQQCSKWHLLTFLSLVLTAVVLAFNPETQRFHNSDSITFSIASYDQWTFYFYGQDRLGMLHSLLAMPIKNPLLNLLFINTMSVCFTFAMFFAMARWLFDREKATQYGTIACLLYGFLSITCPKGFFISSLEQIHYSASLFFVFSALLLVERQKLYLHLLAFISLLLASWLNIAAPIFVGGLIALKLTFKQYSLKQFANILTLLLIAFFTVYIPTKLYYPAELKTPTSIVTPDLWADYINRLIRNAFKSFFEYLVPISALYLIHFALVAKKSSHKHALLSPLICILGAIGFWAFLASLSHVGGGFGYCRACYSTPILFLLITGASFCLLQLIEKYTTSQHLIKAAPPLLLITCTLAIGLPSPQRVENTFETKWGAQCDLIMKHNCDLIGGDSYVCYDLLFYTNFKYYKQGSNKRIFPYTTRDEHFRAATFQHLKSLNRKGIIACYMPPRYLHGEYRVTQRGNGISVDTPAFATAEHFKFFTVQVN